MVGPRALLHPRSLSQLWLPGPCPSLLYHFFGHYLCYFICSQFQPFRKCWCTQGSLLVLLPLPGPVNPWAPLKTSSFATAALIPRAVAQLTGLLIWLEKLQPKGVMAGWKELIPDMVNTRSTWQLALGGVWTPRQAASSGHGRLKNWSRLRATVSRVW